MHNYYEILGLPETASISDVKAAFRQLAKQYHPDINPKGREHFNILLVAYETLSDPQQKYIYDTRLRSNQQGAHQRSQSKSSAKEKNWRFDEREMRRRQYYNDHIKKYEKKTVRVDTSTTDNAPPYNEFKYILYATPLAVLLFIGIMYFAGQTNKNSDAAAQAPTADIKTRRVEAGYAPYSYYFGQRTVIPGDSNSLIIKNLSGQDVVVCLFANLRFLRCCYIHNGVSAEIPQLPAEHVEIRFCSGTEFDPDVKIQSLDVAGAFIKNACYYKSAVPFNLSSNTNLTLLAGTNTGFKRIEEKDFFKTTYDY